MFTLVLWDFPLPIIIGGEHTYLLLCFAFERITNYPFIGSLIGRLTLETILITHLICENNNTTLYIPSLIGGLVKLLSFLFGGGGKGGPSVKCSPEKGFKGSSSPGTSPTDVRSKTFFSKPSPASPIVEGSKDIRSCNALTELLSSRKGKPWPYPLDWEFQKVSSNKGLGAFRVDLPNILFVPKNYRGMKVNGCAEVEGPIVEILFQRGKKK